MLYNFIKDAIAACRRFGEWQMANMEYVGSGREAQIMQVVNGASCRAEQ
jgi:hypothetical protein